MTEDISPVPSDSAPDEGPRRPDRELPEVVAPTPPAEVLVESGAAAQTQDGDDGSLPRMEVEPPVPSSDAAGPMVSAAGQAPVGAPEQTDIPGMPAVLESPVASEPAPALGETPEGTDLTTPAPAPVEPSSGPELVADEASDGSAALPDVPEAPPPDPAPYPIETPPAAEPAAEGTAGPTEAEETPGVPSDVSSSADEVPESVPDVGQAPVSEREDEAPPPSELHAPGPTVVEHASPGDLDVETDVDGLTWDAVAVALAPDPPIPTRPPSAVTEEPPAASQDWPAAREEPATAAGWTPEEMTDEVADFWYPERRTEQEIRPEEEHEPEPEPPSSPSEPPPAELDAETDLAEWSAPVRWEADDDPELVGLQALAADWAADSRRPAEERQGGDWDYGDRRPGRVRRLTGPLAGRWAALRRGERVNVILYALTGVSIVAMALELLAGPDSLTTDVSTTPAPVVTPSTTIRPNTTVTFTVPKAPEDEPVVAGQGPTPTATSPVRVTPTVVRPAPEPAPDPDPEPTSPPAQTTTPTQSPSTTRATPPTTSSGFPEPTPPVLPTFPGPPLNQSLTNPTTPEP